MGCSGELAARRRAPWSSWGIGLLPKQTRQTSVTSEAAARMKASKYGSYTESRCREPLIGWMPCTRPVILSALLFFLLFRSASRLVYSLRTLWIALDQQK